MARTIALACYGAALIACTIVIAYGMTLSFALERELFWARGLGWCALIALMGALSMSPLARVLLLLRRERAASLLARLRRLMGICAAALATTHGLTAFATYLAASPALAWSLPWVRSGIVSLTILLALWLTSYPRLVRLLRVRLWKPLHRLSYVAGALVVHHVLLAPFAPRLLAMLLFAIVIAMAFLRALPLPRPQR